MHSKIIQLSEKPINRSEWCEESDFYENFCGYIADYVDGDLSDDARKSCIEDFKESIRSTFPEHVELTEDSITFKEGFCKAHDEKMIKAIKETIDKSGNNYRLCRWTLITLINDIFGWYVYENGFGYQTEESFLTRELDGRTFFFGAVIDYHF